MEWRTPSHSLANGNCVQVASWRKPSRSSHNGACAEVGQGAAVIGVRDTKQAHLGKDRTVLVFSAEAFAEFTDRVKLLP